MAEFRNKSDLLQAVQELAESFNERWVKNGIESGLNEMEDLARQMERSDFWDNPEEAKKLSQHKSGLEKKLTPWKALRQELHDFPDLVELTLEETKEVKEALHSLETDYSRLLAQFDGLLLSEALMGQDDGANAIITISAGAGGTESQDWAEMLHRMYSRWFAKKEYSVDTLDLQYGEEAGIKTVTMLVQGENAFGYLKAENGVHRLVRISPFDSNKRRHTSFAAVHVMPELDDNIDIVIEKKDLREDTYRASGAGGQHINKTDSAIRITHLPTGIVVQCQNERSQHKNRATAMKMLKSRLYELEKEKQAEDVEARSGEKRDIAWGSQIRSYVFHPYKLVKDLRTDYETSNVDAVMDGELDDFVDAYLKSLAMQEQKR
jgi:peptide chain release factor 2